MTDLKRRPDLTKYTKIDRILIVRYFALGDIALSTPVIKRLREQYPEAKISYLVWRRYADALRGIDQLDDIIILDQGIGQWLKMIGRLKKGRYDLLIDLMSSPGSAMLSWLSRAGIKIGMDTGRNNWCYDYLLPRRFEEEGKRLKYYTLDTNRELMNMMIPGSPGQPWRPGVRSDDIDLEVGFPASLSEDEWALGYFAGLPATSSGFAGITASSNYQSKSWPEERIKELATKIKSEFDITPVIIWGPGEEDAAERIRDSVKYAVMPPLIDIPKLGALIKRLRFLVGIDSGPKHLAVLEGIPTVTLFGQTDPMVWDPVTEKHRIVFKDPPCSPCRDRDCRENRCMTDIQVDDVLEEIRKIL